MSEMVLSFSMKISFEPNSDLDGVTYGQMSIQIAFKYGFNSPAKVLA